VFGQSLGSHLLPLVSKGKLYSSLVLDLLLWYGMVWCPSYPRQCVLSLRAVASCSVDPSGHSDQ
jgi:hypothetical protein